MTADRLTRWAAVAAVLGVAAVAAWISYRHAVEVVTAHGEAGIVGRWYPVAVDGLIVAASMVLLDAARHREPPPVLAWLLLAAGIGATLAVNVLAGTASGPLGAVIAAWPALAFVGCYELLMMLVRAAARRAPEIRHGVADLAPEIHESAHGSEAEIRISTSDLVPIPDAPAGAPAPVTLRAQLNGHADRAEKLFAADVAAGKVPGVRRIMTGMKVGDPKARLIQEHLRSLARSA